MPNKRKFVAYALPMVAFVALMGIGSLLRTAGGHFLFSAAEYWIYPVQTVLCGALLIWFRRYYEFHRPRGTAFSIAIGVGVFLLWIAPQAFLGFSPRSEGFNPDLFVANPAVYSATVGFRFLRLVVVVPFVEEIFWRGFLLRYFIDENFDRVPFGTFSWLSFSIVTIIFGCSHSLPDWPAALLTGAIYNGVAYRTKSLSACVITHAVTNLLLGLWIMQTRQWGFW
jgi:CAAX prenyl protease-like protein